MTNEPGNLALVWHIHQPAFIPDAEICEKVTQSYSILLGIHRKLDVPFSLNITGALLDRLVDLAPTLIDDIKTLKEQKSLELLASAYYHPLLPILSFEDAKAHIRRDLEAKRRIFHVSPKGFWPTELAWAHWLVPILVEEGIKWVIIDSGSYLLSSVLPAWGTRKVLNLEVLTPELRTVTLKQELHCPYRLGFGGDELMVILRDNEMSIALTRFEEGVLYKPDSIAAYTEQLVSLIPSKEYLLVIGNDGEKINPQTARAYRQLLERLRDGTQVNFVLPSDFLDKNRPSEPRYFPASTSQFDLDAWIHTMDDLVFLLFLRDVREKIEHLEFICKPLLGDPRLHKVEASLEEAKRLMLQAQDSSHLFWRFLKRTRQPGYECAMQALAQVQKGLQELGKCLLSIVSSSKNAR